MVKISKPYKYGADADGNRYIWTQDVDFISDISGDELDRDDLYQYEPGYLCSYDELIRYLDIQSKYIQPDDQITCCRCGRSLEEDEEYFVWDNKPYDEDCLSEILWDKYRITDDEAINNFN